MFTKLIVDGAHNECDVVMVTAGIEQVSRHVHQQLTVNTRPKFRVQWIRQWKLQTSSVWQPITLFETSIKCKEMKMKV